MTSRDTSDDALRAQRRVLAAMTPGRRLLLAAEMSDEARAIAAAGIRLRHPDWTEERVRRELLTRLYGAELVERAFGPDVGP